MWKVVGSAYCIVGDMVDSLLCEPDMLLELGPWVRLLDDVDILVGLEVVDDVCCLVQLGEVSLML